MLGVLAAWVSAWLGVLAVTTQPPWAGRNTNEYVTWLSERGRIPSQRRPTPRGEVIVDWSGCALHECVTAVPLWGGGVPDPIPEEWLARSPRVTEIDAESRRAYTRIDRPLPSWVVMPEPDTSLRAVATHSSGWPWPALRAVEEHFPRARPPNRAVRDALVFPGSRGNPGVWLPLRPLWLGLLADAVVYAACVALLAAGFGTLRDWRRSRRGRCTRCGYDRRGVRASLPCPECGWRSESAAA